MTLRDVDLSGADLHNANLTYANLDSVDLSGANLSGADLYGSYLHDVSLSRANLRKAIFFKDDMGTNLEDIDLSGADLSEAILTKTRLLGSNLTGAVLHNADLRGAAMGGSIMRDTDFSGADLRDVDFASFILETDFTGAILYGADLRGASLDGVNFLEARIDETTRFDEKWQRLATIKMHGTAGQTLDNMDFRSAYIIRADFQQASMLGADFELATLENANFEGAILKDTRFVEANLEGANLRYADLTGANLQYANLAGADLTGAVLTGADLRIASMANAILSEAVLLSADLTGSVLAGAKVAKADFSGAILSQEQLTQTEAYREAEVSTLTVPPSKPVTLMDAPDVARDIRAEMLALEDEHKKQYAIVDNGCVSDSGERPANCTSFQWVKYATSAEWETLFPDTHFYVVSLFTAQSGENSRFGGDLHNAVLALRNGRRYYQHDFGRLLADTRVLATDGNRQMIARAFALMSIGNYLDGLVVFTDWGSSTIGLDYALTGWTEDNGIKFVWEYDFEGKCLIGTRGYIASEYVGNFREAEFEEFIYAANERGIDSESEYAPDLCK